MRTEEGVDQPLMVDRRSLLVGALVTTAMPSIQVLSDIDPVRRVEHAARDLADAMRAIHGGTWSVQVSHATGFAAVSKDFS